MRKEPVPAKPVYRPEEHPYPKLMYSASSARTLQATSAEHQKQLEDQGYATTPPPPAPPSAPSETKDAALARQQEQFDAAWERINGKLREVTDLYNKAVSEGADVKAKHAELQSQHATLTKAHEKVTAELTAMRSPAKKGPVAAPLAPAASTVPTATTPPTSSTDEKEK